MTPWNQGRAEVDALLTDGRLQRVPANREHAAALLDQAERHLRSARALAATDPAGAYSIMYDAARKALTAVLIDQGLRPTTAGGHVAVYDAALAQLHPPLGPTIRPFRRMRRRRNDTEYPQGGVVPVTAAELAEEIPRAAAIVEIARKVAETMPVF